MAKIGVRVPCNIVSVDNDKWNGPYNVIYVQMTYQSQEESTMK